MLKDFLKSFLQSVFTNGILIENHLHRIFYFFEILKFLLFLVLCKKVCFWKIMFFSEQSAWKSESPEQNVVHLRLLIFHIVRCDITFPGAKTDRKNIFSPWRYPHVRIGGPYMDPPVVRGSWWLAGSTPLHSWWSRQARHPRSLIPSPTEKARFFSEIS